MQKLILFFIPENLPIFLYRMIDKIFISGPLPINFFLKHPRVDSPLFSIAVYGSKVEKLRGIFLQGKNDEMDYLSWHCLAAERLCPQGRQVKEAGPSPTATAQVGIVNHTGK
ncbi:hypothetical protein ACQ4WY_08240 [Janthinobacterium sp. LB2P49]|uniref:hypothetical protein n=1 Tax=Janthinobacterium sp. LB2P49 TaxID=3424198 RepID=UPI003F292733